MGNMVTIGIDLGTTFSAIATVNTTNHPEIIQNQGKSLLPSVIYFSEDNIIVGDEAKEMQAFGEDNIASFFKRNMGDNEFILTFHGKTYTAVELSTIILKELKAIAETALGTVVEQAVITVPAYFNNFQREATIQAGEMAGLKILRIINEPTAAALAYGIQYNNKQKTVLVYDLGGGTFDVTVVQLASDHIHVLATDGDHELGGKDWDDRIATYLGQRFLADHSVDPLDETSTFNDLLVRCETAKKQLSNRNKARISISHEGERESYELSRQQFEEITRDLMERTQMLTNQVLQDAGLNWKKLDGVLLVGGSTRMPMVTDYIVQMSGKPPMKGINVDEAVVLGAAIQADLDANAKNKPIFGLAAKKDIQDVMSHSLGMVAESANRSCYVNSIIISKNKPIPSIETRPYQLHTARHQDNTLEVYMLQGESDIPTQCIILGQYTFSNITHIPNKPAIIDIEYAYDKNGVVKVSAKERATGRLLPMKEQKPSNMSWLADAPPKEIVIQVHLSVLIAVDLSGSMSDRPLEEAQKAAECFINQIDLSHASIGLMVFADKVLLSQPLCQNTKKLKQGINNWEETMNSAYVGWGNAAEPFSEALALLKKEEEPRFLIVLTDGVWYNQENAIRCAKKCHSNGIEVIAIGFGGADKDFLKQIATSDENALFTDLGNLVTSFSNIAQELTETSGGMQITESGQHRKTGLLSFFK